MIHRVIVAARELGEAFRTQGPGASRSTGGRTRSAGGRAKRRNPWPRCSACFRRVPGLCPKGCGVCPLCCPGHKEKKEDESE